VSALPSRIRPRLRSALRGVRSPRVRRGAIPLSVTALTGALLLLRGLLSSPADGESSLEAAHVLRPAGLPLEANAEVERALTGLIRDREGFQGMLDRKGRYAAMIRAELDARGMPPELIYLALIESGYSNRATSSVDAAGVWQIMPATARGQGLRVDGWVDERRDPVRSTRAALEYLQSLHDEFGSWFLAAAAYNAGPARVRRALAGIPGPWEEAVVWRILPRLPSETRHVIPRLVAASIVAGDPERFGFLRPVPDPLEYDRVFVPGSTSLLTVSRSLGTPAAILRDLNPHLVRGVTPPGISYPIRVPVGHSPTVLASMPAPQRSRSTRP